MSDPVYKEWHHSPSHLFIPGAAYIVTGSTRDREHFFDRDAKRTQLMSLLFEEATRWDWRLEAWAIMSNHYHFVARAPDDAQTLRRMIQALHSKAGIWLNQLDGTPGRKVLYQYFDTCITNDKSYFARLHYVHHNPARHGLVDAAENYPWCSMNWFRLHADPGFRRMVLSFKIDQISVYDDF